jgi:DNA-binding NtrC family response regulator
VRPKVKPNHEEKKGSHSPRSGPETEKTIQQNVEELVLAYLNANLSFKDVPLKQLMDNCEKKILIGCLRLTQGSQKEAAAALGLKPTALFEKMRKHRIDAQRIKRRKKVAADPPEEPISRGE